jgi:hypothetical protein
MARHGISRQQSRRVLLSGLAGPAVRVGRTLLYDEQEVRSLSSWTILDHDTLRASCPSRIVVVRLGPGDEPGQEWSWEQRAAAIRLQPYLGFPAWAQIRALVGVCRWMACVATVCGYPVLTAELTAVGVTDDQRLDLRLEPAGDWAALLERRRLVTSPGPPWLVLGEQPYLGRAARERRGGHPAQVWCT